MLKQQRLDSLSDGIFAIVMTLLVLEIRVPEISEILTELDLAHALVGILPLFFIYATSFTLLYVYWRGQHYISSVFAHNLDNRLTSINAIFLLLIGLVPFSTHFLGLYLFSQLAILVYGLHMLLISATLLWMRVHVRDSDSIESDEIDKREDARGMIRIVMPGLMAMAAIGFSFVNTVLSLIIFGAAIFYNLSSTNSEKLNKFFDWLNYRFINRRSKRKTINKKNKK
ncbi:MAG: putative membrane protein [Candidatus Paceibacteria bacterium]|jgi:uncharacterized membrane protein